MALVSRLCFLSSHSYKNVFSRTIRFPFHQYKCRVLFSNSHLTQTLPYLQHHYQSTNGESNPKRNPSNDVPRGSKLNQKALLKLAIRDYGATVIVFHVAISLASLGICYAAISNGVDAVALLTRIGFPESVISSKVAVGGGTFVLSYAVHKVFAPVRIAITLFSVPFIVRYLRKINLLKPSK